MQNENAGKSALQEAKEDLKDLIQEVVSDTMRYGWYEGNINEDVERILTPLITKTIEQCKQTN